MLDHTKPGPISSKKRKQNRVNQEIEEALQLYEEDQSEYIDDGMEDHMKNMDKYEGMEEYFEDNDQ